MQFTSPETVTEAGNYIQDTIKPRTFVQADSLRQATDSGRVEIKPATDTGLNPAISFLRPVKQVQVTDTVSVCKRNPLAGIIYSDTTGNASLDRNLPDRFPIYFTGITREYREESRAILVAKLKPGQDMPVNEYQFDWIIPLLLFSALIYSVIRAVGGNIFRPIFRFLTFQGINEKSTRETGDLYQLPATLFNLASFISISLFAFLLTIDRNVSIPGIAGFGTWSVCLAVIIAAVTLRHIICLLAGNWSSQEETFTEYLKSIYAAYRISGVYFFFIVILVLYTSFLPDNILLNAGLYGGALIYLLRISRLLLIFLNRHISLFYYILYLCALEILPVVVLVKYVTGLV